MTRLPRAAAWRLAATLLCLLAAGPLAAQGAILARILTFRGAVSVGRAGRPTAVTARGFGLVNGDTVTTGADGAARIAAESGARATMGPNSELQVGTNARGNAWRAAAGKIAVWLTGRGRTEVITRGAVAAAEGTGFQVEVAADGTSVLTVAEGVVDWSNDLGAVQVAAGQQSTAVPGQAPTRPIAVDASGVRLFEATVENLAVPLEIPLAPGPRAALAGLLAGRQQAAAAAPNDPTAQTALGDALLDVGRSEEALAAYRKAEALAPNSAAVAGKVSLAAIRLGRSDVAEAAAGRAQQLDQNGPEGPLAQGRFALSRGDAAAAVPLLQTAATRDPARVEASLLLGVARFREHSLTEAETALRDVVARDAENHAGHAYLSSTLVAEGKLQPAEAEAHRAVELAPESSLAHQALGAALLFSGRGEEAVAELRRAVELDPVSPAARAQLSRAYAATDRVEEAEAEGARAVSLDPDDAAARTTLGVLFAARKDTHRAEREFREALRVAPSLASARTGLSGIEIQRGRFGRALQQQEAALDLDTGSPQAFNNLGAIYTANGHLRQAVEALKQAIRLQPGYAVAHGNLAIAYLELNRYADALREGLEAVRLGERSALLHTTLARIYIKQNRLDRALAELRFADAVDPLYPLQHFYLAQLYRLQGRDRDGIRTLLRGLALDPATAVEQRQYARTETTHAFGDHDRHHDLKTDGRGDVGRLSYFLSASEDDRDAGRRHSDLRDRFLEGIVGYQPDAENAMVLFASSLDERGERPGRLSSDGTAETPVFDRDFNETEWHVLDRHYTGRRSFLTLNGGYRHFGLFGDDGPGGRFFVRDFGARQQDVFAEARWETYSRKGNGFRTGVAWTNSNRSFTGLFPDLSGANRFFAVRSRERPDLFTGWAEFYRRLGRRFDLTVGAQGLTQSGEASLVRPKLVARYRPGGGNTLAFLAYPTFQQNTTDLLPVETWGQPFELGPLDYLAGGSAMNYELAAEHPVGAGSLFSGVLFYRTVRGALIPTVDPDLAPIVNRLPALHGRVWGGQLAYEHSFGAGFSARAFTRYTESRDEDAGRALPYFPKWQSGLRFDYVNRAGIRAQIGVTYVGRRLDAQALDGPSRTLGAFVTTDLRVSWQQNLHLNWFIQVNDLFDRSTSFYNGFPSAGRTVLGGVEIRLK